MKKNKIAINVFTLLSIAFLAGCGTKNEGEEQFTLISPAGAPTITLYDTLVNKKGAETTTKTTDIPGYLKAETYNYVVFDSISALKLTNNAKVANYTYKMMLTSGNFHLAGISKTSEPKVGDKILTFGENLIPDLTLKTCYPELFTEKNKQNIKYVNSVSEVVAPLISGLYNGESIDYAFIAEPALTNAMSKNSKINDILNINEKINTITNGKFNYVPQAALFVKDSYLEEKPNYVAKFLEDVKQQMKDARGGNLEKVTSTMDSYSVDLSKQASLFGFNKNIVEKLQKTNRIGVSDPQNNIEISNINDFLSSIKANFSIEEK